MNFKTALFDMDGVLLDSRPVMEKAWQETCRSYDCDIPFDDYIKHVGKPFEEILKKLSIPNEMHRGMKKRYGLEAASMQNLASLYRGTVKVLRTLKYSGMQVGIVTSKEFWRADR